jgi:hypothetical protein
MPAILLQCNTAGFTPSALPIYLLKKDDLISSAIGPNLMLCGAKEGE